jgi:2-keto-3-deoxy-L-rhamnonate aldolase RhmA
MRYNRGAPFREAIFMVHINGWMSIPDAYANISFAGGGWDSVTLDAQHGLFDAASVTRTLLALPAPSPRKFVRVAWNEPGTIGKILDAGADGVIVPMVDSAAEAKHLPMHAGIRRADGVPTDRCSRNCAQASDRMRNSQPASKCSP